MREGEKPGGCAARGRYSGRALPRYRHRPGCTPHPRRHRDGHSAGRPEPEPRRPAAGGWAACADYRYAVDLYNEGYFWECHEILEAFWRGCAPRSAEAELLRALVQVAAARLKRETAQPRAAASLARKALRGLAAATGASPGFDVPAFAAAVHAFFLEQAGRPPRLQLDA